MSTNLSPFNRNDEANTEYHNDAKRKTDGIRPEQSKFVVPLTHEQRSAHINKVTCIIEQLRATQGKTAESK